MTNYSRSVLKSNGFHHSENLPVKFVFSSKTVPANIAQKLPSQRCSQPFLIPLFNFSHKRPTFAFTGESGYTLGFRRRIAHSGLHAETGGFTIVQPRWAALFSLQFGDAAFFALRSVFSVCTRRGGITILGALCAFSKRPVLALLNRLQRIWTI